MKNYFLLLLAIFSSNKIVGQTKLYNSDKYLYSIQYPLGFEISSSSQPSIDFKVIDNKGGIITVNYMYDPNPINLHSLTKAEFKSQVSSNLKGIVYVSNIEKKIIDGKNALIAYVKITRQTNTIKLIYVYLYDKNYLVVITASTLEELFPTLENKFLKSVYSYKKINK